MEAEWPNELIIIKLPGVAGSFCDSLFPMEEVAAAAAWCALNTSKRQPHEGGLAVLLRMPELTHSPSSGSLTTPGPTCEFPTR